MSSLLKVGELAKRTGLSVRTLHYYDEIGLLSPSHRTGADHRLYDEDDIVQLQKILSLRQLGFSLQEIRACLENPAYALPQIVDLHRTQVQKQIELSRTLHARLNAIANELQTTQSVAVENLIEAMETITMSEQYFTPQQQATLDARFQEREAEWQDMLTLARSEMNRGRDFSSVKVQALAHYWQRIMKSLICGDEQLYESFAKVYQNADAEAASWGTMDADTFDYILKAIAFASLSEDIQLHISEQNYSSDAIDVIQLGQDTARKLNLDVFGTESMLLGLLAEGNSIAAHILTATGVTFEATQNHTTQILGSRPIPPVDIPQPPYLPFVPRSKRVLELAREQMKQFKQPLVSPNHLLLGILNETTEVEEFGQPVGVAARILREKFGIDLHHLERELKLAMTEG